MEDDLEEREMNALRQKALSTLPPKRREYRARQEPKYGVDVVMTERDRELPHRSSRSHYQSHGTGRDAHALRDKGKTVGTVKERGRAKKHSSSRSSSHSFSRSRSYSSYSSSGSSTTGSRSRSSSTRSHSSYSSYTRSSYSSSRRSLSASPHSRGIREKHLLPKVPHSEPRSKTSSSKLSSHRHQYPPSSQWYDDEHQMHSYGSQRSPPRTRKGYPLPSHHATGTSRDYHDYPPAKRRHTDFPEYQHRHPLSSERYRLRSPPPPPPPPALQRKERIIRRVRRSPLRRSPPPRGSTRAMYNPRPISPRSRYSSHRHRPYRRSYSPPPPPLHSRDIRPRRGIVSDRALPRPSSRDLQSLCGPPIHLHDRDRVRPRSPERRALRPSPRRPPKSLPSSSHRSRRVDLDRRREDRFSGYESGRRRRRDTSVRDKTERKENEPCVEKDKASAEEQSNSSGPPSLTSPTTAQLLWDEEDVEIESKKEEETKAEETKADGKEEGEVEELDYDETMEDLDLHPTGNIDEGEGAGARRLSVKAEKKQGTVDWDETEEVGEVEEQVPSLHSDELLDDETEVNATTPEALLDDDAADGSAKEESAAHISSPIRVSPDRKTSRVESSPQNIDQRKDEKKLSVKERLYVSRNTIEQKKRRLGHSDDTSSKLPRSLANRLGPSPGLHGRSTRRSEKSSTGHKGSALAIAAEYKRRREAGQISPSEAARAARMTKRINAPDYKPSKHRKMEKSEENERELDKKIDSIKKRNKALERRCKEIERDKQLYG